MWIDQLDDTIERLEAKAPPKNIKIVNYWKYQFTIEFDVDEEHVLLECGGDSNGIYRFDPYGGWDDWRRAGINAMKITPSMMMTQEGV